MKISGLSYSSYSTWSWCQWKYYLTQILGFKDESGPSALIGNISHKVLEILSRLSISDHDPKSKLWSVEYLWQISFNRFYRDNQEAENIKDDKLRKVIRGIYWLLDNKLTPITKNTIAAEAIFNLPIVDPAFQIEKGKYLTIRGRIDRVDKLSEDTILVCDYKSGSLRDFQSNKNKDAMSLKNDIQPSLYYLASLELYPWAKNVLVSFIYFAEKTAITIPYCEEDIKGIRSQLWKRFATIKATTNPERNLTWKCASMCNFRKNGTCESVFQESQKLGLPFIENKYTVLNYKGKK